MFRRHRRAPLRPLLILFPLLSCIIPMLAEARSGELRIVQIDVGQGDATLIVGPTRSLLFDSGPSGKGAALKAAIQAQGLSSVDYFVAGHYHEDHIGSIDELLKAGVPITQAAYDRGGSYSSITFTDYTKAVSTRRQTLKLGQQVDLGEGAIATCVAINGNTLSGNATVSSENDRSIALVLRYGTFDYFIASDLTGGGGGTADVESRVAASVGDVDVLHVGHHGSDTSTNMNLLNGMQPEQAFISCGDGNSYHHPTQSVLDRLEDVGSVETIWQTEQCNGGTSPLVRVGGTITLSTDGQRYSIRTSVGTDVVTQSTDGSSGVRLPITPMQETRAPEPRAVEPRHAPALPEVAGLPERELPELDECERAERAQDPSGLSLRLVHP